MLSNLKQTWKKISPKQFYLYSKSTPIFHHNLSPSFLLNEDTKPRKRTKTVCTIGPKSQSPQSAGKLIDQGMSVARLNFSHGDHQQHRGQMVGVLQALKTRPNSHVSFLLDTKGPQVRTGNNKDGKQIKLVKGQTLQITTDYNHLGTSQRIACSYQDLPISAQVGKKILIADGGVTTTIIKVDQNIVTVLVENDGSIGSKKNMCLPGAVLTLPTINQKDKQDIIDFGLKYKVDYIAVSFARYKKDLDQMRRMMIQKDPQHGPYVQIISKIQNHQAIHNLDQIIQGSDGIMIARGDLGMQIPIQKVVVLQKYITQRAVNAGRFVITATQMLQSMQTKPRPTRAQVSDITNAVYDLTDANMTSGQTTNGQFPTQCAQFLKLIAQQAQACCDYKRIFQNRKHHIKNRAALGTISLSFELDCEFIFIQTDNIKFIHRLSSLRPKAFLIVFSDNPKVKGAVAVDFGVYVYPKRQINDPLMFLKNHGQNYGFKANSKVRVLKVEMEGQKITSSKIHQIN